ncbi:MAG: hypothetical protein H8E57_01195 [Candidatus Cloacimonetes bacterium]|nr:hypothetical protein [Candidatus Cloacimonadota bacterium]
MSLKNWFNNGWLKKHQTSLQEIKNLLKIVDRDLSDAKKSISLDWQFGIAYNAALKLCTILLYTEGYKPERNLQHFRTIQALPLIMGNQKTSDAQYLNTCRIKRNTMEYDYAGGITYNESSELIDFVETFKQEVVEWLKKNHPEIAP